MKQPAWSHSSLKDFEGCQRRYYEVKVLKNYPFTETEATRYGNQVHQAIEDFIAKGTPIPPEYEQFKPVVEAMMRKDGRKLAEYEMALTELSRYLPRSEFRSSFLRQGVRQLMCNFPLERNRQMILDYSKNIIQKL